MAVDKHLYAANAARRTFTLTVINKGVIIVLDETTHCLIEYHEMRKTPSFSEIWNTSYSNELGCLCQGAGHGNNGKIKQRVAGTDTFFIIKYDDIPHELCKEICYTTIMCKVLPQKSEPKRTRITIDDKRILYPGNMGMPTGSLKTFKLVANSLLSRVGAKFDCFDVKEMYLSNPLNFPEYVKIELSDIPK